MILSGAVLMIAPAVIIQWLKARLTYPRTGYVAVPDGVSRDSRLRRPWIALIAVIWLGLAAVAIWKGYISQLVAVQGVVFFLSGAVKLIVYLRRHPLSRP
jgi:predicted small integral membrane protein